MGFVDLFLDHMPDEITGQPGTVDTSGDFTPSGDPVTLPCRYEMSIQIVPLGPAQGKTSRFSAIVGGTPGFNPKDWRFTISSRFSPYQNIIAVAVIPESDENGPCYEEVLF